MKNLTAKQAGFVNEYLECNNATEAAIKAGYSKKTARFIGSENLTKPNISKTISERQEAAAGEADISLQWILKRIKVIAEKGENESNKLKAMDMLMKHLGAYTDKTVLIGKLSEDQLEDLAKALLAKIN